MMASNHRVVCALTHLNAKYGLAPDQAWKIDTVLVLR